MPRVTHDDPDRVLACPECDKAGDIYQRTGNGNACSGDPDAPYACHSCGETFESPRDRKARDWQQAGGSEAGHHGIGQIMAEMTVEEFDAIVHGERDAA